jgi:UDP-N-acetylmuramoylalanine--D-glutamate ligase
LTARLLCAGGLEAAAGGNTGRPFCDFADAVTPDAFAVLEVSSFMLERVFAFRPRIAALLNLTPDHLDRHKSMERYIDTKRRLFARQRAGDYAGLNYDDPLVRQNAGRIKSKKVWFSRLTKTGGAHLAGGEIYFGDEPVCPAAALKIPGAHNMENALAAVTAAKILGLNNTDIEKGLASFRGVSHRLELVAENSGVKFYNDSKATNIDSTLKAVAAVTGCTVLLLGGSDKGYGYEPLFRALPPHIAHCVFMGAIAQKLQTAADSCGYTNYTLAASLGEAVEEAAARCAAAGGGNVLLSPAAASFDRFENFEKRGEAFIKITGEYLERKTRKT